MADVFVSAPGTVATISDQKALPGSIMISDPVFPGSGAALISGIAYRQAVNVQFNPSLDGALYLYAFGDQMGVVDVEGMAFPALCNAGGNGLFDVMSYYENNRASKSEKPIIVKAGSKTIAGFLTGVRIKSNVSAEDPVALINTYAMVISAIPQR